MAKVVFLVGSVYGNSTSMAEECAEFLRGQGHESEVFSSFSLAELQQDPEAVWLICTSTTGQGELPDNIYPLYQSLKDEFPLMPDRKYGVIALGDSSYDSFADAGRMLDEMLQELQAKRLGEVLLIDACETADPEGVALDWIKEWIIHLS
ncbi:flavodoxin [Nitrincola tibetensis]|uniref:Flavodoxin n=1 Tax=Nitrincola tibetensis TaxID=2219697 RepID=A0A364NNN0_9GAMM|nr:flavodoxin [Nitrincola tibetensis]RAU18683.1 flavodoxin [Nitrincola tibetensis]